jgi:hypothetical protein
MNTTRRLGLGGVVVIAIGAMAIAMLGGSSSHSKTSEHFDRALGSSKDPSVVTTTSVPPTTVATPDVDPGSSADSGGDVDPGEPPPQGRPQPRPESPAPEPQVPHIDPDAVRPLPDRTGPSITNIRFSGCVILADITDPAGVASALVTWSGVPDPQIPGVWYSEPGSAPMHKMGGVEWQGSRARPYQGRVYTVTAVDKTMVGNRSQASITIQPFNGRWPC